MDGKVIIEKIDRLMREICKYPDTVDDDLAMLKKHLCEMPKYFDAVISMELSVKTARFRYSDDPEMMRSVIENIDSNRRDAHMKLTRAINITNRMCGFYEVPQVFPVGEEVTLDENSKEDREIAVDMCYNFCVETFLQAERFLAQNRQERETKLYEMSEEGILFDAGKKEKKMDFSEAKNGVSVGEIIKKSKGDER